MEKHIKQEFVYRFEYGFGDSINLYADEKEERLINWVIDYERGKENLDIECFCGGPTHFPYITARSEEYDAVKLFATAVRRRLKGKKNLYFEED